METQPQETENSSRGSWQNKNFQQFSLNFQKIKKNNEKHHYQKNQNLATQR